MEAFLKNAIKNIFLILLFLFIGIVTEFDWSFWLLFLYYYVLRHFIDPLKYSLNIRIKNLNKKLDNHIKNRPTD